MGRGEGGIIVDPGLGPNKLPSLEKTGKGYFFEMIFESNFSLCLRLSSVKNGFQVLKFLKFFAGEDRHTLFANKAHNGSVKGVQYVPGYQLLRIETTS